MTTSPTGHRITLADRLAEIAERYGAEHLVVQRLQRAHDYLAGSVERTGERMWAAGVGDWKPEVPQRGASADRL